MATIIQRNLTGGELSPSLRTRVDLKKYKSGAALIKNFYVTRHGGLVNRPGTKLVSQIHPRAQEILPVAPGDEERKARLIPFIFSDEDTAVLEFGDGYMRVIRDGDYVKETQVAINQVWFSGGGNYVIIEFSAAHGLAINNGTPDAFVINGLPAPFDILNGRTAYFKEDLGSNRIRFNLNDSAYVGEIDLAFATTYGLNTGTTIPSPDGFIEPIYSLAHDFNETQIQEMSYIQSLDVLTLAHNSIRPKDLSRVNGSFTNWQFTDAVVEPSDQGTGAAVVGSSGGSSDAALAPNKAQYVVTVQNLETGEESLPSTPYTILTTSLHPKPNTPITLVNNLATFNFSGRIAVLNYYKSDGYGKPFGFIGSSYTAANFQDIGLEPDYTITPPETSNFLVNELTNDLDNFPGVVSIVQQRKFYGKFAGDLEAFAGSKVGLYTDFSIHRPIQDDDAIFGKVAGLKFNEIRHIVELKVPIIFTASSEWILEGSPLTPTTLSVSQHSYNGCSAKIRPVVINDTALYVQARETIIRDLGYSFNADGYNGNDLTLFANHLFDDFTITSMDYQQIPDSILWVTRSDGALLSLTYIKEQNILGWCQHDLSGGFAEQVVVIPEGNEDAIYIKIKRTINGVDSRFVERLSNRSLKRTNGVDNKFCDSHLSYDGYNVNPPGLGVVAGFARVDNGTTWEYTETLDLITSNSDTFVSTDVGNEVHFYYTEKNAEGIVEDRVIKFEIITFVDDRNVRVRPNRTVPVELRGVNWEKFGKAVDEISGLHHLEGETLAITGDANVVGSPLNEQYTKFTVQDGKITLDKPYVKIHAGLSYTSDLLTLQVDGDSSTVADKKSLITAVALSVLETRGLWVGYEQPLGDDPVEKLQEKKPRSTEHYDSISSLRSEVIDTNIDSSWEKKGQVFVRQIDPVPATILAVLPNGLYPFKGG